MQRFGKLCRAMPRGDERVFCRPGESCREVLDALVDAPDVNFVVTEHEDTAANMAEADGKLPSRPRIFVRCAGV